MTLPPGFRLGAYEIVSAIGAGGMGEVYRARDTRLARDVALKILPAAVASDPDRLRRFEQEGRAAAMLNHPNILVVHDVGAEAGVSYVVSELLEGETLRTRLARGALPPMKASEWGGQIARGLAAAHAKGLIHRDLKPDNLFVTREGHVKILDFGLAKTMRGSEGDAPRQTTRALLTEPGVVLGTPAYMAPEQVRGLPMDHRADLFAFGAVLVEMLTGVAVFARATPADTTMAILNEDPTVATADGSPVTAALARIARRCLEKRPEERFQSASDLAFALDALANLSAPREIGGGSRRHRASWTLVALLTAAILAIVTVWALMRPTATQPRPLMRTTIALPADDSLALEMPSLAISPDDSHIAYVAIRGSGRQLYLRPVNQFEAKAMAGTDGALMPFFSPDGKWLGFFANGKVQKVSVDGGAPVALGDAPDPRGGHWGDNDLIVFTPGPSTGLWQVSAAGGTSRALTTLEGTRNERSHRDPRLLPGGKAVIFTVFAGSEGGTHSVAVQSLVTGERHTVLDRGESARYTNGRLIYGLDDGAMVCPFDLARLQVTGPSTRLTEHIAQSYTTGLWQFDVSADGSLAFVAGGPAIASQRLLTWVDRHGVATPLSTIPRAYAELRFSPDGQRLAVAGASGRETWIYEVARDAFTRLTTDGQPMSGPVWSPDGARLAFGLLQTGVMKVFAQATDGSGAPELLLESDVRHVPESWSPDGQTLSLTRGTTQHDILSLSLEGRRTPQVVVDRPGFQFGSRISPDGRWLAYTSDESGQFEVYVTRFPNGAGKSVVSTGGGTQAVWARSGRELFYRNGDRMMAVAVDAGERFAAANPSTLFEGRYYRGLAGGWSYDVSVDGARFAMIRTAGEDVAVKQVNLIVGWADELLRQAGQQAR